MPESTEPAEPLLTGTVTVHAVVELHSAVSGPTLSALLQDGIVGILSRLSGDKLAAFYELKLPDGRGFTFVDRDFLRRLQIEAEHGAEVVDIGDLDTMPADLSPADKIVPDRVVAV